MIGGQSSVRGDAERLRVLFLCTGNSCRSQMAEGWARVLLGEKIEAFSAGTAPKGIDPQAVRVMREAGIDISGHTSNGPDRVLKGDIDVVITVCDHARESCPVLPGGIRSLHIGFDDPPALAEGARDEEEALYHYRRVRDEIRKTVEELPERLGM